MYRKKFIHKPIVFPEITQEKIDTYPGVTRLTGLLSANAIEDWKNRIGHEEAEEICRESAKRGTLLHKVLENYINNEEKIFEGALPKTVGLFRQIKPIIDEKIGTVYAVELNTYSDVFRLKGCIDLVAEYYGILSIIDWKTKGFDKTFQEKYLSGYFLQATIYALILKEMLDLDVRQIVIVGSVVGGVPQVFVKKVSRWKNKVLKLIEDHQEFILNYKREVRPDES
jgi:ATP-dependent exoDNAse (exonuclease V) beta subunit